MRPTSTFLSSSQRTTVAIVLRAARLTTFGFVYTAGAAQDARPPTADSSASGRGSTNGSLLSSDALEELRRALDPTSSEQIVAFAVEIEPHHSGTGTSVAAAVGGGVLQELQTADEGGVGGGRDFGKTSDWHRCVDGLRRSGVVVGESEARSWLQRTNR